MDRTSIITGLRELADWLEQHPGFPGDQHAGALSLSCGVHINERDDFIRAASVLGGDLDPAGRYPGVGRRIGGIRVWVQTDRATFGRFASDAKVATDLEAALATEAAA